MTTRPRRWRAAAIRLAACAAIGALVTVGVAWAAPLLSLRTPQKAFYSSRRELQVLRWPAYVPASFPPPNQPGVELRAFGVRLLSASAYDRALRKQWGVRVEDAGWPWYALQASTYGWLDNQDADHSGWTGIQTPIYNNARDAYATLADTPLFPGFALDTAFYAAIALTLWSAPPALRRRLRRARGHCPACGYNLNGAPTPTCPECGA